MNLTSCWWTLENYILKKNPRILWHACNKRLLSNHWSCLSYLVKHMYSTSSNKFTNGECETNFSYVFFPIKFFVVIFHPVLIDNSVPHWCWSSWRRKRRLINFQSEFPLVLFCFVWFTRTYTWRELSSETPVNFKILIADFT